MLVLLVLLAFPIFHGRADAQCFDGWVHFQSSCYGFGDEYITWAAASSLCQTFDANLAEIETSAENEFLKNYARNKSYPTVWIGGTDIFSESYWVWSGSKQPVKFFNWGYGEPNHAGGDSNEDCIQLYRHKGYAWNDEDCRQNCPFVCEIQLEEDVIGK